MNTDIDIKKLIAEELKKETPDWDLIERLSREEVENDESRVRFSVDAAHIQRLGFELVGKQETALSELIKNAYDADATEVNLIFKNHDQVNGTLVIEDNGAGMNAGVIRQNWMRISTANKKSETRSPKYGRLRAGRKGIGRFAVQRLGKRLRLETEVAGSPVGLAVDFNWEEDFLSGKLLYDIFSKVSEYPKPVERQLTRLSIEGLRDIWSDSTIKNVWRSVLLLQTPFAVKSERTVKVERLDYFADPGFEVTINGTSSKKHETRFSIDEGFLKHAIAEISGEIDKDGNAFVRVVSSKLDIDETHNFEKQFYLTGPITFTSKYFIYTPDMLSGLSFGVAIEMGRAYGGVRVYRNGFRVLPYGEPQDDWLRLDHDSARRNTLVPANNQNFFGQVILSVEENVLLEETSSREGLIENEAFKELSAFARDAIRWSVARIAAKRGRKQKANQKGFVSKKRKKKTSEVIGEAIEAVKAAETANDTPPTQPILDSENLARDSEKPAAQAPDTVALLTTVQQQVRDLEEEIEEERKASVEYEEMLRILASLGLSITVFGHEIKGSRTAVTAHLAQLEDEVQLAVIPPRLNEYLGLLENLKGAAGRMLDLGGYIAGLLSSTESRALEELSVAGLVERFVRQFGQYMERQGVEFKYKVDPMHLRTTSMHASEVDSVLLNFLTNSMKSMKKARVSPRRINIEAVQDGKFVLVRFEDNGLGVPEEIRDQIFDAFFTTTLDEDDVAGPGTGLGLKIVSDIASNYGGSVTLGEPSEGFTCCMEFRVLVAAQEGGEA